MLNFIRIAWAAIMAVYGYFFVKDYRQVSLAGKLDDVSVPKAGFVGFITNFFDTLGIGSFAPTVALNKFTKMGVKDRELPGLLNVADTLPVMLEAVIFTTVIEVEPLTLISMLVAAALGSYLGAGVIAKMDEVKIQKVMGVALLITAILMICKQLGLIQGGGDAIGLSGIKLIVAVVGNFIFGALMSAGIGLYAPCMALVYFLGMSPQVAFPIMMGSCATLMPVGSIKFIKEGAYPRKAALIVALSGAVGVFVAAYLVKSLPMDVLTWLVIAVIFYTSASMLVAANKSSKKVNEKLEA
ncbi:MAG: sulfite exporter TauE/SafE family protein [Clostridiales bacterium]|mgnify:CR=1 FL=1|uniref:sulfite exporter TauE/SafE family protein n=1 Tax=Terrisporobacter sp. TaxID=1965305 RepID=UPI002A3F51BC|nr:sulfite exporter TauE/SafE family protein [Terrisporobacter sp.]MCI5628543.1 sulfite exporter TauE/SafE family protein [Clostridium sp.]MDD5878905.1 sulfite exporter TauE/SafE family protein [Clostridiales bacterium]MCI6458517.1 sulfite exporter TauE/SafE family protein [Clostridium sp.]MCI7205407.1 sulfite exporter TauE/SafE family protein [Clostridium sp.]MDY4736390.1 sulfite exporter TauE/SafE family protein [Terrisporobacter sp.]